MHRGHIPREGENNERLSPFEYTLEGERPGTEPTGFHEESTKSSQGQVWTPIQFHPCQVLAVPPNGSQKISIQSQTLIQAQPLDPESAFAARGEVSPRIACKTDFQMRGHQTFLHHSFSSRILVSHQHSNTLPSFHASWSSTNTPLHSLLSTHPGLPPTLHYDTKKERESTLT